MGTIREPIKKTSIEKKKRITEKGFELMCNKGYHNVSCVDIAKYAGVSTGLIYQYFTDKKDIFLEGVKDYSNKIMFPMINILDNKAFDKNNLRDILSQMIESFINTHTMKKEAHEELMAMSHLDEKVGELFNQNELKMTENISNLLINNDMNIKNVEEKVHIIMGLVDNYCHEVVYHHHKKLNYDIMREEVLDTILFILNKD